MCCIMHSLAHVHAYIHAHTHTHTHSHIHTHTPHTHTYSHTHTHIHTPTHTQHVLKLLRSEVDPDAADDKGDTPLHAYVKRKDKNKFDCLMTLLIHSKCELDNPDEEGMTPLHLAAQVSKRFLLVKIPLIQRL